jgi:tyrosyl-tRNA synthetase
MAKKVPPTAEELENLKNAMESTELDFANAKLAYYHRTEYKGQLVAYENLEQYAKIFIAANHAYQKALYGKVRITLSVARLMRE